MTITVLGALYLAVSLASLVIQATALRKLYRWPPVAGDTQNLVYRGLLRTSAGRTLAALAYVTTAVVNIIDRSTLSATALAVYTGVQLLWWANAIADVRLRRRLAEAVAHPLKERT